MICKDGSPWLFCLDVVPGPAKPVPGEEIVLGPVCEMTGNGGVKEEPRLIAAMLVRAEQRIARHRSRPRRDHQPGQMDEGTATFDQRDRIRVDGLDAVELIFGIHEEPPWRTWLTNFIRAITRIASPRSEEHTSELQSLMRNS